MCYALSDFAVLEGTRGRGHVFYLGDKYCSDERQLMSKDGKEVDAQMGCYGIGVSRTAAAVERDGGHDDGIIWPD